MNNCVIYARYSPRPEDCDSIEVQESLAMARCERVNLRPVALFFDENTSARKVKLRDRSGGSQMLAYIRENGIQHIVTKSLDRMFRNTIDGLTQLEEWAEQSVMLHDAARGVSVDVENPDNEFIVTILLGVSQAEAKRTARRTSEAMQHYQKQGRRMSRYPDFWSTERGQSLAPTVRQWKQDEALSYRGIAERLNEQGYDPPNGKGWYHGIIGKLFQETV